LSKEIADVIERRILDVVRKAGEKGILQREIWAKLSIDSRKGHRILKHLEAQGYIERIPVTYRGRRTYIVKPTSKLFAVVRIPPVLEEIPCFYCEHLPHCSSGYRDPLSCEKFIAWLKASKTVRASVGVAT